jgi:hypothetical protein
MLQNLKSIARRPLSALRSRNLAKDALRLAPWLVFGPITGVMSEAAIAAYKNQRPVLAGFYVVANLGILAGMPLATAALMAAHH